ncbi:hypothetical protein KC842_00990 [Candidatus Nomurabacteria bacterium]|nr:hypothetical protein [Candidatus Nomurabacteria bacterium]USN94850.1 MAG: hypothetical protein H6791_00235 [Candidatus Nomurabacteria bacterium]
MGKVVNMRHLGPIYHQRGGKREIKRSVLDLKDYIKNLNLRKSDYVLILYKEDVNYSPNSKKQVFEVEFTQRLSVEEARSLEYEQSPKKKAV